MWYHVGRYSVIMGSYEGQREAETYLSEPGCILVRKSTLLSEDAGAQRSRQPLGIRGREISLSFNTSEITKFIVAVYVYETSIYFYFA